MTTVLVVDDDAPIRLLCRVNLMADGISVLEAADAEEARRQVREGKPDLVLLDVMLPGDTGFDLAEELLADEQTAQLPIIFLSARAELRDRERGIANGAVDYVVKPFNPLTLVQTVKETLAAADSGKTDELRQARLAELHELLTA